MVLQETLKIAAQVDERFKHIERLPSSGIVTSFYLRAEPKSRMESVLVMFSPEGVQIVGDMTFGRESNAFVSNGGYGVGWFSSELSEDYLLEKFMRRSLQWDVAEADVDIVVEEAVEALEEQWRKDGEWDEIEHVDVVLLFREVNITKLRDHRDDALAAISARDEMALADAIIAIGGCDAMESFGLGYDTVDAGVLIGIQRAFRRLYDELAKSELVKWDDIRAKLAEVIMTKTTHYDTKGRENFITLIQDPETDATLLGYECPEHDNLVWRFPGGFDKNDIGALVAALEIHMGKLGIERSVALEEVDP